ncbi:hypothetical protein [Granulosicoccus antarcticus]|uniref:Uncharacterized protein n=1 Tax=Granulosicoccus antarcticus IMCC3135 TaxID=1192854 RepID=A0A2Z2P0B3_9GAMM|nr:hypothetical protein [Granulosicoccus antarcticus]ASJ74560.1 hypothetical protein IMCC3135_22450 [Granulosicoccus antarcticus IMCC3135]
MTIYTTASPWRLISACVSGVLVLVTAEVHAQDQTATPIITFDQSHPLIAQGGDSPMVSVYAGGRVVVNREVGMRNPGLYEFVLNDAEITELVELAQSSEIAKLTESENLPGVEKHASDSELVAISDSTTSTFEFNRLQGGSELVISASEAVSSEMQSIQVDDVIATANAASASVAMQPLKELHVKMIELFSRAGN